jgi:hypothetical protein
VVETLSKHYSDRTDSRKAAERLCDAWRKDGLDAQVEMLMLGKWVRVY